MTITLDRSARSMDSRELYDLQDAGKATHFTAADVYVIKNDDGTSYALRADQIDYSGEEDQYQAVIDAEQGYERWLETRYADQIAWEEEQYGRGF